MKGIHRSSFIRNAATLTIFSFLLSACLTDEEQTESVDEVITDNEVSGSVGDGPIVGATMRILRNDGVELSQLKSDASASYNIKIRTKGKYYPLGIDARNGTDVVTNTEPDFDLLGAVLEPGKKSVANVNPFSTFAIELARDLSGGIDKTNIATAQGIVMSELNNGLTSLATSGVMATKIDGSNIAEIVRASEALGETVRRTRDALAGSGFPTLGNNVVRTIASDLRDGVIDGRGGPRADARFAAVWNIVSSQVLLETMANELHVNGADATDLMRNAIQLVSVGAASPALADLTVTAEMIARARTGVVAAHAVTSDTSIADLLTDIAGIQSGSSSSMVRNFALPGNYRNRLSNAVLLVAGGNSTVIESVNEVSRNRTQAIDSDPAVNNEDEEPNARVLSTTSGEDWSLPADVQPKPGTGLFVHNFNSTRPEVKHRGLSVAWADLNPAEGSFDWSSITSKLNGDYKIVLLVKANVTERQSRWGSKAAVPQWVLDKHSPPIVYMRNNGPDDYIKVAAPWNAGVQAEHLAFIREFGRQGFHNHPNILGVYVHGISTSFGEELWADSTAFDNLVAAGMTPARLEQAFTDRLNAWATAFGSQVDRLAWVKVGWFAANSELRDAYEQVGADLNDLAYTLGMGTRWGHSEKYWGRYNEDGQFVDNGYLVSDDNHPIIAQERYFGAENEKNQSASSPDEAYEYRTAMFRILQMKMRLAWVEDRRIELDPVISKYFTLVAGKNAAEAPDAWSVMREADQKQGGSKITFKNLERWLYQRETEGSFTSRTQMKVRSTHPHDWDQPVDWTARTTDRTNGQNRITLFVDHAFLPPGSATPLTLKVTWLDDGAIWKVRHATPTGSVESDLISGVGDGQLKTTSIALTNFASTRTLQGGFDIALVTSQGDLTVSAVRLLR